MNQIGKVGATLIIWMASAMMVTANRGASEAWVVPVIALMALVAATTSMRYIWRESDSGAVQRIVAAQAAEKAKRSSRVERLLDRLDDSELAELRSRLTGDDGEQIPLESLLRRDDEQRRSG
jgi:hypothetical protein